MKRVLLASALVLMAFSVSGVVGNNASGDVSITRSSGSASASQSVGPNGTEWKMNFSESSTVMMNQTTGINRYSYGENSVSLSGVVQTPQPCYTLNAEIEEGDNYVLNVASERIETDEPTACADVISYRAYNASFQDDEPFQLEVFHDGERVQTLVHPDYEPEKPSTNESGFMNGFIRWFTGLF
jgi:hypothetical protein